ncbi:MAG: oligosaccharide flippase family protein, partial [Casimicrobiaceae bacterium]
GLGYWALVGMRMASTLTTTVAAWIVEPWRPGLPRRHIGAAGMLRFGGLLTGVNLMNYLWRNVDNVLIGWFWGPHSLGLYQKAYGLLMLPITQVNSPISGVAVAALSRIQSDSKRHARYFVGGFSITVAIVLPIVVAATIFAEEIIRFVLGQQWVAAVGIFRWLAPAALIGALLNPLGWLFISSGRADRQLRAGFVWSPIIILGFALGLGFGPQGVAIGYSAMSAVMAIPLCMYAVHGTSVRVMDIAKALKNPLIAGAFAGLAGLFVQSQLADSIPVGVRAIAGCFVVSLVYALVLLVVLRQWKPYRELVRLALSPRPSDHDQ